MEEKKMKTLEDIKLTKEEALEWIEHLKRMSNVKTPLSLVYKLPDGDLKAVPYLDKTAKDNIVGVLLNGTVWGLTQLKNVMYFDAKNVLKEHLKLPSVHELEEVNQRLASINETMEILRENGIVADNFLDHGSYWTNQCAVIKDETSVRIYSLGSKREYIVDPYRGKLAHARTCYPFYKK